MTALETVKSYYNYFNNKDFESMLSLVDDFLRHEPNQSEPRIGKELFNQFLTKMDKSYSENLQNLVFFESETEGKIAAEFFVHGIYKNGENGMPQAKGQGYELPAGAFLEVKNGLITRVTTYYNLKLWLSLVL